MNFGVNFIKKLINIDLSINQYFICCLIIEKNYDLTKQYIEKFGGFSIKELEILINKGFVQSSNGSYDLDKLNITTKFEDILFEKEDSIKWIDDWYDLFPKGIKSGNYQVRSDKPNCIKKLKKFLTLYPQFNKDIIMQATKAYINEFSLKGYNYMKLAPYFIEKDGTSVLWGYCNNIIEGETNNEKEGDMIDDV